MDPAGKRDFPDPARVASGAWTTDQGLYLTCPTRFRPTQAVYGGRFFADRTEARPERGEFISDWIRSQARSAAFCGCLSLMGD